MPTWLQIVFSVAGLLLLLQIVGLLREIKTAVNLIALRSVDIDQRLQGQSYIGEAILEARTAIAEIKAILWPYRRGD